MIRPILHTWEKLRYHPVQAQLWAYTGRFAAIVAGRGSGKTEICRRKLILEMAIKRAYPDPLYFYVLPTYAQAKRIVWYPMMKMIPPNWVEKNGINKTDLSITLVNGAKLYIVGADKPERLEGVQADFVMIDESSDQRPGLFTRTVVPMLSHRYGNCYRLGVPKRNGIGRAEFRDFFLRGQQRLDGIASFYWKSSEILTSEQLTQAKSQLSDVDFAEQFEASWIDVGSTVYYNLRNQNIRDDVYYDPTCEIIVGCDFNVNPMCWILGHMKNDKFYVFDEIYLKNTNTPAAIDHLYNKYYNHIAGWRFYGDASSKHRHASAVRSDYLTIKNDARFGQKKVLFPRRNPALRDRFAAVNAAFLNASGEIRCYISTTCKHLINDLNAVSYVEGTTEVEDYSGTDIGHMSDAFGYAVHGLMPIRLENTSTPSVWSTGNA